MRDIVVEGRFVTLDGIKEGYIGIDNDKIAEVSLSCIKGREKIKAEHSCLIFPGFMDIHVHLREDESGKWTHKENFRTGSMAALNGGVTRVVDMPNTPATGTTKERIENKVRLAKKAKIPVQFYGGVATDNITELSGMKDLIVGYKAFLCQSTGNMTVNYEVLEGALQEIRKACLPITLHCEEQSMVDVLQEKFKNSKLGIAAYPEIRAPETEYVCVEKTLKIAERFPEVHFNIAHVSTPEAMEMILKAKERGMKVSCEVTPHHLFFNKNAMKKKGAYLKMNPPLRDEERRAKLIEMVRSGAADFLASDHAPHTTEEKESENPPSGVPQLDTYGLFLTWLLEKEKFDPVLILRMCSYNPARFVGLENEGRIEEGCAANLTILDLKHETKVNNDMIRSKCGWTPYEGITFPGCVKHVMLSGEIIASYHELFL